MTARNRPTSTRTGWRGPTVRRAAAIALVTVLALLATGCGRHFHVTYHGRDSGGAPSITVLG